MTDWYVKHSVYWFKHLETEILHVSKLKQETEGLGKQWKWQILNLNYEEIKYGSCYKLACAKACAERESK